MTIEFGLTTELTNTRYAPLAVLLAHYQQNQTLQSLKRVEIGMKTHDFTPFDKLSQVLVSILAGCCTLFEVNTRLKAERHLAQAAGWSRFADQSTLSRVLDGLTLTNIDQLRHSVVDIWRPESQIQHHDWRGFLLLDYDLSGLPCSSRAQKSQKGYFSGKKTSLAANWPASALFTAAKRSGLSFILAIAIPSTVSSRPCARPKVH